MYTTFHSIDFDDSDPLIWYFNKVYLYVFISLFIYVVLSLFIGIVADTYERIKVKILSFIEGNTTIKSNLVFGNDITVDDCVLKFFVLAIKSYSRA